MAITANSGPTLVYGAGPNANPSLFSFGIGRLDNRFPYTEGQNWNVPIYGWAGMDEHVVVDAVPSAISPTKLAASQAATAGTPLTLVSSTGNGITVGATVRNATTGASVTALAIDGAAGTINYASGNAIQVYDPRTNIARNVTVTSAGNDSGGAFLVSGYDLYGFPMTERITGANAGLAAGAKAFKYIASVTPQTGVSGGNVTVGVGDVYGFPLTAPSFGYVFIIWNNATIVATTGFTAASLTSPATSTSGDTRGTYAVQSASDGTKRLYIAITPAPYNLSTTALTGVTPA